MNNFFKTIVGLTLAILVVSCSKDSDSTEPLRDYATQYADDLAKIEEFLQTHYITVTDHAGFPDDQSVTFTKIPTGGTQTSIWNSPDLVTNFTVDANDITYKLYYLKLRGHVDRNGAVPPTEAELAKTPCNVDKVLTSYVGQYLYSTTETVGGVEVDVLKLKQFEENANPQTFLTLSSTIRGWSEVFPRFRAGTYAGNPDGTITYSDFGAGIMFLPSGLGYYASGSSSIPAYSPLIFTFKLYEIQRVDNDGDGIYSYQEDLNNDGYLRVLEEGVDNPDNTNRAGTAVLLPSGEYSEEDEVPDFLDVDDDGDFIMTKTEIKNPLTGVAYPYNQIPLCPANNKKVHLTAACN